MGTGMLEALDAPAHIASVTLTVRDLPRVAAFYRDVLGLDAAIDADSATLAAADGTVLLRLVADPDARPPAAGAAGLFHTAFLLPSRVDLARWVVHAQSRETQVEGASDHRVSEAIYLSDPEGNGIEVYVDRPRALWPRDGAGVAMATDPLDGPSLMAELRAVTEAPAWRFPAEGRIGHVHLKVGDLAAAEAFYTTELGMEVMARYPGAAFLSWGGYHHHVAVNVWRSRGGPAAAPGREAGLLEVQIAGLARAGAASDPAGNRMSFQASASIS
jgi:catechol 2,3-dioxygenase